MRRWGGLILLLTLGATARAQPGSPCTTSCVARTASCRAERCPGATGADRRHCRDVCRAATGCAAGAARIRTLAAVVTECRSGPAGWTARQRLEVRRGDCAPVTLMALEAPLPVPDPIGLCALYGQYRSGYAYVIAGAFERVAVSPDGETIVFEVTQEHVTQFFAPLPLPSFAIPRTGIFVARADGTHLRWIAPASRDPVFRVKQSDLPPGIDILVNSGFQFSPDGTTVLFSDHGQGADGSDATQLVTLDVKTGRRRQVTTFVAASQSTSSEDQNVDGIFIDDDTISGYGYDRDSDKWYFTVQRDGSRLRRFAPPTPIPGSKISPTFQLASQARDTRVFHLPAATELPYPGPVNEVFVDDGRNLLQITNFGRTDTVPVVASRNGERIFLAASADPFGRNPLNVCQLFSIDRFGGHLRELTTFRPGATNSVGCFKATTAPSCRIEIPIQLDTSTTALIFGASCDPFGMNPLGGQVFAVRTDGSGLRQITSYRGMATEPDGTVTVELPGPIEYSRN